MLSLFLLWRLHVTPMHGYAILKDIHEAVTPSQPSTLYSLLTKLEHAGLVKSRIEESEGRERKVYQTTPKGWALFLEIKRTHIQGVWKEFALALVK
jgi:DNA-binding PadR family transcriptional regulator